jgi:branched-chain amino acid transport system permease protein
LLLEKLAVQPVLDEPPATIIIITIGASLLLRGVAQIVFGKQNHSLPAFLGETPISMAGATIQPQALGVLAGAAIVFLVLRIFLTRTATGRSIRATAANRFAAKLFGVEVGRVFALAFALSAAIGAVGGFLITPITLTRYDVGTLLALKGFAAAMLGGMGNPLGALIGGLLIGLMEAFSAGYVSSTYKDGIAFTALLAALMFLPNGLLGAAKVERV